METDPQTFARAGLDKLDEAGSARFLEEGSRVCVLDRDASACERVKRELHGLSEAGVFSAIIADVTDLMQVEAAFAEATPPYLGLSMNDIGMAGADLLADRLLQHGGAAVREEGRSSNEMTYLLDNYRFCLK